ncbi:hypothetical protein SUGI_0721400 [Cryptomeria japonica]|nr:hypothetical protein SUGI_0721400 [Cryptomeria japonica]
MTLLESWSQEITVEIFAPQIALAKQLFSYMVSTPILLFYNSTAYIKFQPKPKRVHYSVALFLFLWATNDFSLKLGSGGFGSVYEGILLDDTKIAVKQLDRAGQGSKEFRAEVETLGNIHHLNLVRLKGFCAEKSHRMLVYERSRELTSPGSGLFPLLQRKAEEGGLVDLVDSEIKDEGIGAEQEAEEVLGIALCCIQYDFTKRPAMSTVVKALENMSEMD